MRRLFGDNVCTDAPSDTCNLTPPAQAWLDAQNKGMAGGHCYGFSVTALQLMKGQIKASDFGGDTPAKLAPSPELQHQLAQVFVYQAFNAVNAAAIKGSPNDILNKLKEVLKPDSPETYTMGIYKEDMTGGHAVTPFAVEDNGGGLFHVLIYDNNYPTITRALTFDTNANTWQYNAATNPQQPAELYTGKEGGQNIQLMPTTPGQTVLTQAFAGQADASGGANKIMKLDEPASQLEIYLESDSETDHGHLLITDPQGRRVGYVNGSVVNEIPGAQVIASQSLDNFKDDVEPEYKVPDDVAYTITIDGSALSSELNHYLQVIGGGYDFEVNNIPLKPSDKDVLTMKPDAEELSYQTSRETAPDLYLGVNDTKADYDIDVTGLTLPGGGTVQLTEPVDGGTLGVLTKDTKAASTYDVQVEQSNDKSDDTFKHAKVSVEPGDQATLHFGDWDGKSGLPYDSKAGPTTLENQH